MAPGVNRGAHVYNLVARLFARLKDGKVSKETVGIANYSTFVVQCPVSNARFALEGGCLA